MAKRKAEAEEEIDSQLPPDCDSDSTLILGGGAEDESPVLEGSQVTESRDVAAKENTPKLHKEDTKGNNCESGVVAAVPNQDAHARCDGAQGDEKKPLSLPRKKTCIYN